MKSIWVPVSGAVAQQQKIDTHANNIANANTTGFKRDQIVFKEYLTALEKGGQDIHIPRKEFSPKDFYHSDGNENAFVKVDGSYSEFSQGQLTPTQGPLDWAINGKGFFEVLTPKGVRYTRDGQFGLNKSGQIVTRNGEFLLSKLDIGSINNISDSPNQENKSTEEANLEANSINPKDRIITLSRSESVNLSTDGILQSADGKVIPISVVEFVDPYALRKEGRGLYINPSITNFSKEQNSVVMQGFLEQSNVNIVTEMSELIKAQRNFESIQRVIKAYDSMAGKSINELTKL